MDAKWFLVSAPIAGLAANVAVQVLVWRGFPRLGLLKSLLLAFAVGLAATSLISVAVCLKGADGGRILPFLLVNGGTYAALGFGYFHFVNLGVTARRPRILREVFEAGGVLPLDDLFVRYSGAHIVGQRMVRLLGSGQVVERDGRYYIGIGPWPGRRPAMLWITRILFAFKVLVLKKRSEFE